VVPEVKEVPIFIEVEPNAVIWGHTRHYENGTRDEFTSSDGGKTPGGFPINKISVKKKPLENPKIRLRETSMFSLTCCKSCRADFMDILRRWNSGEFVSSEGTGDIPVRVNGTTKMVTQEQWEEMCNARGEEGREPVRFKK
jgi:hypothetical protein